MGIKMAEGAEVGDGNVDDMVEDLGKDAKMSKFCRCQIVVEPTYMDGKFQYLCNKLKNVKIGLRM